MLGKMGKVLLVWLEDKAWKGLSVGGAVDIERVVWLYSYYRRIGVR
jgi:hypothetical protein